MVEQLKIVRPALNWQRIKLENRGGSGIDLTRWDNIARIGRSVQVVQLEAGIWVRAVTDLVCIIAIAKCGKISIPHILAGYGFLADRLSAVAHAFVVAKEEGVLPEKRAADGTSEGIRTFGRLLHLGHSKSGSIQRRVLKILKCRSMECIGARLAGSGNVRCPAILHPAPSALHLHFRNALC